ncbi:hypothetical protein BBP40_009342 [Aspergillus hancockii]|nr:hypothetical protein BBP40_009342 [Aspergillus hancockii]
MLPRHLRQLDRETTDVNSMVRKPVSRSRLINSIFIDVGTGSLMFCKPSRGPTSTIRTAPLGSFIAPAAPRESRNTNERVEP